MEEPIVYIVDDDSAIRKALSLLLAAHGLASRTFESPKAIVEERRIPPNACLILDARMPGMTGIELLDELKTELQSVPVFMITGHGDAQLIEAATNRGVIECFQKPFDSRQLISAVKDALDGISAS